MCEIVRAMIAGQLLDGVKLDTLTPNSIDNLDCPGDEDSSEICAVSGGSAPQNYAWYIMLEGVSLTSAQRPLWEMEPKSKEKLDLKNSI